MVEEVPMRFAPRPRTGLVVLLLYLVVFYGVWQLTGVDYQDIGDTARTIARWYVAPLAAGALLLVVAVTVVGWWRPALFETRRATPRWLWVGPGFMTVGAVAILMSKDTTGTTSAMLWLLVVGSVLVGFCEELVTRGVLVVGFRAAYSEPRVWFLSSLLFGLLHLPNWYFGAGPGATAQVVLAFMSGSMLYLVRRMSGTLVLAMLVHGLWDFASFIGDGGGVVVPVVLYANAFLGLGLVLVLLRHERGVRTTQVGVDVPAATAPSS